MRPAPQDCPASLCQCHVVSPITSYIGVELGLPVVRIGLGARSMDRTAVPEAAVDEDGEPRLGENDIGMAPQPRHRSRVLAEAKTSAVQS